jgi:hypothetical protein
MGHLRDDVARTYSKLWGTYVEQTHRKRWGTRETHIKACQPDGMYLTARATWFETTDSLTTAKYEHVLVRYGNFWHWLLA